MVLRTTEAALQEFEQLIEKYKPQLLMYSEFSEAIRIYTALKLNQEKLDEYEKENYLTIQEKFGNKII